MKQEIRYKGYSAVPSDYDCLDGELALAVNIIQEDGALRPILPATEVMSFSSMRPSNVWVRETSTFKHYIYLFGDTLYFREITNPETGDYTDKSICYIGAGVNIYSLEIMGNTIIVATSEGLRYLLWKNDTQEYIDLGNMPECPISFGLQGKRKYSNEVYTGGTTENDTQAILAQVNKFIADKSVNSGCFIFPFFVRYAYRLYDGMTLTHHSAPILMMPSTYEAPFFCDTGQSSWKVMAAPAQLDYKSLLTAEAYQQLLKWKDIIRSVDIFISAPIYSYDQNGVVDGFYTGSDLPDSYFVGKLDGATTYGATRLVSSGARIKLPMRSWEKMENDVRSCSQFYFLKSLDLESLAPTSNERNLIYIEDNYLQSLTAREMMSDDYQSHDILIAKYTQSYNNRLNAANLQRKPFSGYDLASMVCYRNDGMTTNATSQVVMPVDGGLADFNRGASLALSARMDTYSYLYYPDVTAKGMNIIGVESYYLGVRFSPHEFLNGAVRFFGFPSVNDKSGDQSLESGANIENPTISVSNKIYTSEVNNPFFFPVSGINTIAAQEIYGIRSAAKALSEGQYGQFPLYAFTDEGVWAMEVKPNGGYDAKQPIIRDVCLSTRSIAQMDSAVAFASQRGIMILEGSQAICISDAIKSDFPFDIETLPYLINVSTFLLIQLEPFTQFLKNCGIMWDYFNQRLIVGGGTSSYNNYAYVYSLESKSWGIMLCNIQNPVKSYPEALALDSNGILRNFSVPDTSSPQSTLLVTRPLKLEGADNLKQVTSVIQRGVFDKGDVKTILYGSRDMLNWHLIASSKDHYLRGFRGTPYKYFRVAVRSDLESQESISGCSIDYNFKMTNHTR